MRHLPVVWRRWVVPLIVLAWLSAPALGSVIPVDDFTRDLAGWNPKVFVGQTHYRNVEYRGRAALQADSMGSASGLVRPIDIDLHKTPYLNWSWAVQERLHGIDELRKTGDDYPARVYVIYSVGPFFWQTRAINYVWSSSQPPGSVWPNAFTANSTMVAVRGPGDTLTEWRSEKRNVLEDIRQLTGDSISNIEAVAIMTDTDNSGQQARAWYGGLFFSAE